MRLPVLPCSLFSETLNVPTELASSTALLETALGAFSAGDEPNLTKPTGQRPTEVQYHSQ